MQNRNYFNNNMQKGIALATCMAIVMGMFTGCGNKEDLQISTAPEEVQKGRYIETELALPEGWKDKNISQIFRSGDELHFLVAGGSEGQISLEEWKLGEGDVLAEVTKDWLKALPEGEDLESTDSFTLLQDADGFFRCAAGDTNWQKLLEGIDTSFSLSDQWCRDIVALSDGSVYAWFGSESGDKIMIYRYDPDAVIEVTEELTLYTVEESFFLQQAAVQYHKQHPEVLIHVDAAISLTDKYSGNADYQQIYQDLNTSLTSGKGTDLMVMDHLKLDTYASKGLLLDLQDVLQPMEENGTLLSNITTAYEEKNGARYAVPLQFALLLAIGRDVQPEEMDSMAAIAKTVSGKAESYLGDRTCGELVEEFYPLIADEILQNR